MSEKTAQLIKRFLQNNHLTVKTFAETIGVSRYSVYKYLKGLPIHKRVAKKIAESMFIPLEKFLD